jgi:uncharacterized protein YcfJ
MNTKNSKALVLAGLIGFGSTVHAGSGHDRGGELFSEVVHARVLDVRPMYREVQVSTPVNECWEEPVTRRKQIEYGGDRVGATLAGGLLGGIIGHQFGKGRGQKVSTALGTIIGAQVGHDAGDRRGDGESITYTRFEQHCSQSQKVSYEERLEGYRVTYQYQGKKYSTRMPYDPGDRIKLNVTVEPVF